MNEQEAKRNAADEEKRQRINITFATQNDITIAPEGLKMNRKQRLRYAAKYRKAHPGE